MTVSFYSPFIGYYTAWMDELESAIHYVYLMLISSSSDTAKIWVPAHVKFACALVQQIAEVLQQAS